MATSEVLFKGVIPPVSTIFNSSGEFDREGMGKLIDFLIESKVDGLFFLGTGGEFSQMTLAERKEITEFCVNYVDGRLPVLIGTGSPSTREVIDLSLHSKEVGADGVVVINPYYLQLSEEFLFEHYSEIASSVDLPIVLYNFPQLTGQDLSPDLVLRLVDAHSNIVGIKETIDLAGHIREMILKVKSKHPHFSVLAGFDDHLLNTLSLGGDGVIPATANFAPQLTVGLYAAFRNNDFEKVMELQKKVAHLPLLYKIATPFVGVAKEAMKMAGLDVSTKVLPPVRDLNKEQLGEIQAILKKLDII
ncbi:dihydrodipicolinate synthase family protein [Bacillus dakarensis]|uniref:dihydrodipicolinate synthase family protein n=1 Tax=Robertmurraya dakarensis TaxID=1926278 RepID=UPI000982417F|nr:dihydrodipicolinate synthase family protein [Bacillus dakarensis]